MKKIILVAMSKTTVKTCTDQLRELFGGRVNVMGYALCEGEPRTLRADVIVFASRDAMERAALKVAEGRLLLARRSLSYHCNFEEVIDLPAGTDVLLVNDFLDSTSTVIALLQTLGIDHINLYPYYPGIASYPKLKIAITPGEVQLAPPCVERVIDIGNRHIDITTMVEILIELDLLPLYADFLSVVYDREIVALTKDVKSRAEAIERLERLVHEKREEEKTLARWTFKKMRGKSAAFLHARTMAEKMAGTDASILILGESGTGKELFAQSIHNASARCHGPFVAVNLAAMPDTLLASELFGYMPGAFTGASRQGARGLFEAAQGGTIFLDEIGDIPLSFQVQLLRVLQEREIRRVGSTRSIPIDVRVIAATNRDLSTMVEEGSFRRDLYYRLAVLPLKMPPLRERGEDILILASAFYSAHPHRLPARSYFSRIKKELLAYAWPGNIRELQNLVEYLLLVTEGEMPDASALPQPFALQEREKPLAVEERIYAAVREANDEGRSIGRRSLAAALSLPESRVRDALARLESAGRIRAQRGRAGLLAL